MRRFSAILAVLLLASTTQAISIGFQVDSGSIIAAGRTIQINIVSDTACQGIEFGAVVEALGLNSGGQAQSVTNMGGEVLDADGSPLAWGTVSIDGGGYLQNYQGCLFEWPMGDATPAAEAGSILASFSYTISALWDGSAFYIAPLEQGIGYDWAEGESGTADKSFGKFAVNQEVLISGVQIATPEPVTIALLGLGSLILYRKK